MRKILIAAAASAIFSGCAKKPPVWIYASLYRDAVVELKPLLEKAVPNVEIRWYTGGSENIEGTLNAELAAGIHKADLIITANPFLYDRLKSEGKLMSYRDRDFATCRLLLMVIGYNPLALRESEAPQTWQSLLDRRWRDKISMGDPFEAGSVLTSMVVLTELYGWDYFVKLRENGAISAGNNRSVISRMELKDRPLGILLMEDVLRAQHGGSPVKAVYPKGEIILIEGRIAILNGTANASSAKKIYDWFLSQEAQRVLVGHGMYSPLPSMPSPKNARPLAELESQRIRFNPDQMEEMFRSSEGVKARFKTLFMHVSLPAWESSVVAKR